MEKLLKPTHLDLDPSSSSAAKEWRHWHKTFSNFIQECGEMAPNKLRTLVNYVSLNMYDYIEECVNYDTAISTLEKLYIKAPNKIFSRHLLATRQQKAGETLDEFLRELRKLGKDCNLKAVSTEQYREELIRDAFINGLASPMIRQRLLENKTLDLQAAYDQAYSLDLAQRNASFYSHMLPHVGHTAAVVTPDHALIADDHVKSGPMSESCRDSICNKCGRKGHFAKACLSKQSAYGGKSTAATVFDPSQSSIVAANAGTTIPQTLYRAATTTTINGRKLTALVNSCSDDSYIDADVAWDLKQPIHPTDKDVGLAQKSLHTNSPGYVNVDLTLHLNGETYPSTRLAVMKDLCSGVLLGQDFQEQHQKVTFEYGGPKPALNLSGANSYCSLAAAAVDEPSIFQHLLPNCKPIVTKSRHYCKGDKEFIEAETSRLLAEGVIEDSISPWSAQVVVVKDPLNRHKKRMCVDYSQTINLYTELDAYPLPRIDTMVNELSTYRVFSTFDLKSAYHQIPLKESDKKYTAFEANGRLYQFYRVPFGVTNGVAVFQRTMDKLEKEENLQGAFPYLDNITIAGHTQEQHDQNVQCFLEVINKRNLTLNATKTIKSVRTINILGCCVGNGVIKPDMERLRPLQELPPPTSQGSLKRAMGMFAYYIKWIQNFSAKIQPLARVKKFPLNEEALQAFELLKQELEGATLHSVDVNLPFEVECDASEVAVSAVLNQSGRPVAFMSRTLQGSEVHYHIIEKEAMAIVEAVRNNLLKFKLNKAWIAAGKPFNVPTTLFKNFEYNAILH
ncbi:uncharacterized protein LOC135197465 [Macrobrachium nipponense]|uniref:uncharacterized protein LOC135197465 n=1 Tax=Macrobrachium nipponense TaxID=159736 RepID=UPI0030C88B72